MHSTGTALAATEKKNPGIIIIYYRRQEIYMTLCNSMILKDIQNSIIKFFRWVLMFDGSAPKTQNLVPVTIDD